MKASTPRQICGTFVTRRRGQSSQRVQRTEYRSNALTTSQSLGNSTPRCATGACSRYLKTTARQVLDSGSCTSGKSAGAGVVELVLAPEMDGEGEAGRGKSESEAEEEKAEGRRVSQMGEEAERAREEKGKRWPLQAGKVSCCSPGNEGAEDVLA